MDQSVIIIIVHFLPNTNMYSHTILYVRHFLYCTISVYGCVFISSARIILNAEMIIEMIRQKPSVAILSLNLIRHPYIVLERSSINGRTFSKMT